MTRAQRLQLRAAKIDGRIAEIVTMPEGERSTEIKNELVSLNEEKKGLPAELERAMAAEEEAARLNGDQNRGDGAFAEMASVTAQASVGDFLANLYNHRPHDGPVAELQAHYKLDRGEIPLDLLRGDGFMAAVTPAPSNTRRGEQPVLQPVFARGDAAFLMIDQPILESGDESFPVLTSRPTVSGPHTDSTSVAETTGSFEAETLQPGRIQASFFYRRTDATRFPQMDMALRSALSMGLSEAVDKEVVDQIVADVSRTDASATDTYASYRERLVYNHIDGRFAGMEDDIRVLVGGSTLTHMAGVFTSAGTGDLSAVDTVRRVSGGLKVSAHIAAVASNKQDTVVRRGARRDMVCPMWRNVQIIFDEVTKAATGEIVLTAHLQFAKKVIRDSGFARVGTQHA